MSIALEANGTGARVAAARRGFGMTQKEFAERVGITLWLLDRIEAGTADAARHLPRIADVTGRSEGWFSTSEPSAVAPAAIHRTAGASALRWSSNAGRDAVLAAFALLVTVRFFTEVVHVLPRAANFIDVPIFLVLSGMALVRSRRGTQRLSFVGPAVLFLCISAVSVVLNISRVEPAPVLVFLYGFLAPIGIFAAAYRLWPAGHALTLSRLLVALGAIQLAVVGVIDLPRFLATGNPDVISGTFGTNAYQLVFFLLVFTALLAGIFTFEKSRLTARLAPFLFAATLTVIFLAQYRALLATTALTVLFIGLLLGARGRGIVAAAFVAVSFAVSLSYVANRFPQLRFAPTIATLQHNPGSYVSERFRAAKSVVRLYTDHPWFVFTGSGPGTFSSRAWQTFAQANSTSRSNVQGAYVQALIGNQAYHTDVSDKYVVPLESGQVISGSRALTSPFSSYVSLLAEVGTFGFLLMGGLYVGALFRAVRNTVTSFKPAIRADPTTALCLASAAGFFVLLQMALLGNWLEVTRLTFVVWMLLGVTSKELAERQLREQ